jgi:hypothetical protein
VAGDDDHPGPAESLRGVDEQLKTGMLDAETRCRSSAPRSTRS